MLTRRSFLAVGTGSLVALGLPLQAQAAISSSRSANVGVGAALEADCRVSRDGNTVAHLKLVGLDAPYRRETRVAQYILNFEAADPVNLPEATYEVFHPTLGRLDLFLQPCGSFSADRHDGIQYRACMGMLRTI